MRSASKSWLSARAFTWKKQGTARSMTFFEHAPAAPAPAVRTERYREDAR